MMPLVRRLVAHRRVWSGECRGRDDGESYLTWEIGDRRKKLVTDSLHLV